MEAILGGRIEPGDVVVIRYEGPKGGPGMREMLAITGAMKGAGRGRRRRRWSPTAASRAAPTASAWATWPPRRWTAGRSPSWREGDRIGIDVAPTPSTSWSTRPSSPSAGPTGSCPSPATPRASWPSTPAWPRAPRRAPSPRPEQARPRRRTRPASARKNARMLLTTRRLIIFLAALALLAAGCGDDDDDGDEAATDATETAESTPRLPRPTSRPGPRSRWRTPTSARSWSTAVA